MFLINLETLILLTIITSFINGAVLNIIYRISHKEFIKQLSYGCFFFAAGWFVFLLRFEYGINFITMALANVLIILMPLSLISSVCLFLEIKIHKLYSLAIFAVLIFTLLLLSLNLDNKWIPGVYASVLNGILYFIPFFLLFKNVKHKSYIVWIILILNLLISLMLIARFFILSVGVFYTEIIDNAVATALLTSVLFVNLVCINAQVLFFPILDFIETNAKLKILSDLDTLTGLFNRRVLREQLSALVSRYNNDKVPFSLILLDLDYFKKVNDNYGHLAGDKVLKDVAKHLVELVRDIDVVIRYGGEEIIIILPDINNSKALEIAERLRKKISALRFIHEDIPPCFQITASFGVSTYDEKSLVTHDLLKKTDSALYLAKSKGRNQVCAL